MLTHATLHAVTGENVWACIVQQQERAQCFAVSLIRKHRTYRKAIANPVGTRCGVDASNLFHLFLLLFG
ncbi:hypothetical protein D3C85_1796090 [compost metagenome]